MRKILLALVLITFALQLMGQEKQHKKLSFKCEGITVGVMFTGGIGVDWSKEREKIGEQKVMFPTYGTISPSLNLWTEVSHHHVMYEVLHNSIQTLNGYFINDHWDVYFFFEKGLNTPHKYLSVGIERYAYFKKMDWLGFVFFADFGSSDFKHYTPSVGMTIHPELSLWTRKK